MQAAATAGKAGGGRGTPAARGQLHGARSGSRRAQADRHCGLLRPPSLRGWCRPLPALRSVHVNRQQLPTRHGRDEMCCKRTKEEYSAPPTEIEFLLSRFHLLLPVAVKTDQGTSLTKRKMKFFVPRTRFEFFSFPLSKGKYACLFQHASKRPLFCVV